MRRAALAVVVAVLLLGARPALGQDSDTGYQVPTRDIIPDPDSGSAPDEAGDRGGGLQLLVLGVVVLAVVGGGWHITRQARRGAPRPDPR